MAVSASLRLSVAIRGTTASPLESDIGRAGSAIGRRFRSFGKQLSSYLMNCIKQAAIIGVCSSRVPWQRHVESFRMREGGEQGFGQGHEERAMKLYACLIAASIFVSGGTATHAQSLPSYMAPIAGKTAATSADIATKDMLALNTGMFELYGDAARIFQSNILSKHPTILGLFSGSGGRMI